MNGILSSFGTILPGGDISELWIRQQIEATIGDCCVKYEIKKITKWQVNNLVAKQYRKGRIFSGRRRRSSSFARKRTWKQHFDPRLL
jgi:hypothetical protein